MFYLLPASKIVSCKVLRTGVILKLGNYLALLLIKDKVRLSEFLTTVYDCAMLPEYEYVMLPNTMVYRQHSYMLTAALTH